MIQDELRQSDVVNAKTFGIFCQQNFGTPHPTINDLKVMGAMSKKFFEKYPGTDWNTLIDVARWCKKKKRNVARVYWYIEQFRWAYNDGAVIIPEYRNEKLDRLVSAILKIEEDPNWRSKFMSADGNAAKTELVEQWKSRNVFDNYVSM